MISIENGTKLCFVAMHSIANLQHISTSIYLFSSINVEMLSIDEDENDDSPGEAVNSYNTI